MEGDTPYFRCHSNSIKFDDSNPTKGYQSMVKLKPLTESCSYIQYRMPLTPQQPCFFVEIVSTVGLSKMAVGVAPKTMRDDTHLGCQNRTLGYHSDTGSVMSSHCSRTQTKSPPYSAGDIVGINISDFDCSMSCVTVIKNGRPVCTQYQYSRDHTDYLPTITLQNGPIDLMVTWPPAVRHIPRFHHVNCEEWMTMPGYRYDYHSDCFCESQNSPTNISCSNNRVKLASMQGPEPLSQERSYYEVELAQVTLCSPSPSLIICLVSGGALPSAPSSKLYYEVLKFTVNPSVMQVGDKLGWGMQYLQPITADNSKLQPIICCVSLNGRYQTSVCYLEPSGGYFPFVAFTSQDFKLRINTKSLSLPFKLTSSQINDHLNTLHAVIKHESIQRELYLSEMLYSPDMTVQSHRDRIALTLTEDQFGVHTFQYLGHPLTKDRPAFQVNITQLGEDSVICVGVALKMKTTTKYPGRAVSSLGYHSLDGKILYDGRSQANTQGHRFTEGDLVMLEMCGLPSSSNSVLIRIWKNNLPVALRYVSATKDSHLYPTVSLFSKSLTVQCDLIPSNMIEQLPSYFVNDPAYWCIPENTLVSSERSEVYVQKQVITGVCLVCPLPMSRGMQHFEVRLLEDPNDEKVVPPMIALTTASPYDPPIESDFRLDLLRFWPKNDAAATLLKTGDTVGWGVIFPDETLSDQEEQIVICYLTINRDVMLTRALIQPAGGLFASIILPYGCDKACLNFEALTINSHPFTKANVSHLFSEAKRLVDEEVELLASGADIPCEQRSSSNKELYKPLPVNCTGDISPHRLGDITAESSIHNVDQLVVANHTRRPSSRTCAIL